ncbi:MAG: GNAT family N-acetyltransferase [Marmoricola sp.]
MPAPRDLTWPRRTERLTLRMLVDDDVEPLWRIRSRPDVAQWMTERSLDLEKFTEGMREPFRIAATIVVEHEGVVVGDLMLRVEDSWAQTEVKEQAVGTKAEIGWCFDPAVQGRGLATEAVRELLRIAFEGVGLHRVVAICFAANTPSWKLMERVGMRREGYTVKDALHRSGEWMDGMEYALLAEEWAASQRE